nr:immunoglobulin heavy chain junction region [Macaca mulatta]MOV36611.1 immunoglobulin heavy chain junction region [Macaca mulatta]MOV36677.1 immunoglobulin heavy chain junction region [Macaca mulatta]MOV36704.1 immunoglobulin heavy chain junction region [Macaca mulatta]
CFNGDYW